MAIVIKPQGRSKTLIDIGIKDIELSGTCFENNKDLEKFLEFSNLQIHNYFPPPKNHLF